MADVAASFEAIAALTAFRARLEQAAERRLTEADIARLAVIAFLHDAGKLHPGFQARGWPEGIWGGGRHGHVKEGAAIFERRELERLAAHLGIDALGKWGTTIGLLHAALAHHGRPFRLEGGSDSAAAEWFKATPHSYDPLAAAAEIGALLPRWFPAAFESGGGQLPDNSDFQHLFCGLVSLADWIGSDRSVFGFVGPLDPGYMARARGLAARGVREIGLDAREIRRAAAGRTDFAALTGFAEPNAQQRMVGAFPLDEPLLILEAETGSGKTEAAFWRFARLFEAGLVDGLYFAVPTRAAAKQLQTRIDAAMKRFLGAAAPEAVLAVPGYLQAGDVRGRRLPGFQVLWDDDPTEEKRLARWAAEHSKRYLAATVAVGTADQAMLAALRIKHAHLRAAALSRSLLVIDEVHASDSYMREIQHRLIKTHLSRGGHAMLMSATLGSVARSRWLGRGEPPPFEKAVAAAYPALWARGMDAPQDAGCGRGKSVAISAVTTMEPDRAAGIAIDAARGGARVLVIRNTVDAAVDTWNSVREKGAADLLMKVAGGPALHHSRFAAEDRALLDGAVERTLHKAGRAVEGVIVIGTQTLEQSLDIDADILVTDLCPMDVLLQRIGRLHRHALARPAGFETPVCHVLVPEQGLEPLLKPAFHNGLGGWIGRGGVLEGIYRDLPMLELTRRLIEAHPVWEIPAMNRFLVESATHPDKIDALLRELGPKWRDYARNVLGKEIAAMGAARNVLLDTETGFAELRFPDEDEAKVRTRLGEEGALVTLAAPAEGPFGQMISAFTLPAHWSWGIDSRSLAKSAAASDGSLVVTVGEEPFHYRRSGLRRQNEGGL